MYFFFFRFYRYTIVESRMVLKFLVLLNYLPFFFVLLVFIFTSGLGIRCFVTCGGKNWGKSKNEVGKSGPVTVGVRMQKLKFDCLSICCRTVPEIELFQSASPLTFLFIYCIWRLHTQRGVDEIHLQSTRSRRLGVHDITFLMERWYVIPAVYRINLFHQKQRVIQLIPVD